MGYYCAECKVGLIIFVKLTNGIVWIRSSSVVKALFLLLLVYAVIKKSPMRKECPMAKQNLYKSEDYGALGANVNLSFGNGLST